MHAAITGYKPTDITLMIIAVLILFVLSQVVYIKVVGEPVAVPNIPRDTQTLGTHQDELLRFAVLGDSTTISQGGEYKQGYAWQTAEHLAQSYVVRFLNVGVSGARAKDVATEQVSKVTAFKPDLALIAVGANDVTHLTSTASVKESLTKAIAQLRQANPNVRIVLTGSPDMGSVPRLPQPTRWLADERTKNINEMVEQLVRDEQLSFAPIAKETGPIFHQRPELFAQDKFHPTSEGYNTWTPVIEQAIDSVLK